MNQEKTFRIRVTYTGTITVEVSASDKNMAVDTALDEINTWSEQEFIENLELDISGIAFKEILNHPDTSSSEENTREV